MSEKYRVLYGNIHCRELVSCAALPAPGGLQGAGAESRGEVLEAELGGGAAQLLF